MINENFKKIFFNSSNLIIISYLFFHLKTVNNLEFYYDDWFFINTFNNSTSLFNNFIILKEIYIVRPIALIYLFLLSLFSFEQINHIYLFNIFIWLLSGIILSKSFQKVIPNFQINIFLMFFLFPSISNSFIYSPIIQGLSTISIFFWTISIFLITQNKNNTQLIFSILFIALSILTYEISLALIPLNIFIHFHNKKIFYSKKSSIFFYFIKIFFYLIILILIIYFIQNFLSHFSQANISKYGFAEKDFFINIKKYFFTPIMLIFYDIPELWIKGIKFTLNYDYNSFLFFVIFNLLLIYFLNNKINNEVLDKKKEFFIFYNFFLVIIFIGIFLIYLVATSVPDLKGYYNRGLLGLHTLYSLFLIQFFFNKTKKMIVFKILIILVLNFNFNSFFVQNEIHKYNSKKRNLLISETINFDTNTKLIFGYFRTYSDHYENYNFIPIFSDEVMDYSMAVRYKSLQSKFGNRVFLNSKCENILKYENSKLFGLKPSSNRKTNKLEKKNFLNKEILKRNNNMITIINFENKKTITTNINDLQRSLKKIFNCY